jgi:hypothetical protein
MDASTLAIGVASQVDMQRQDAKSAVCAASPLSASQRW